MNQEKATGQSRGFQEAVAGSFAGAVVGVIAARLLTALLVGVAGLTGLELRSALLSDALLLLLPPLAAVIAYRLALHLAGVVHLGPSTRLFLLLSPLASSTLWEAQQQLGVAELWSLRVVSVVLLTVLAPLAHGLSHILFRHPNTLSGKLVRSR